MSRRPGPLPDHGTRARYHRGCKCDPCRAANNAYGKRAKYRAHTGTPVLVDPGPARAHINNLRAAGLGYRRIAQLADVTDVTLRRIAGSYVRADRDTDAEQVRVRRDVAQRILAVQPDQLADGRYVDATGTRRRLQALTAIGYSGRDLARILGWSASVVASRTLDRRGRANIWHRHAAHVRELYAQLENTPGPTPAAAARARRNGWAPPVAWGDDIDDPSARPAVRPANPVKPIRDTVEDWNDLRDYHRGSITLAAQRLDIRPETLARALLRGRDELGLDIGQADHDYAETRRAHRRGAA